MRIFYYVITFLNLVQLWTNAQFLKYDIGSCEWLNLLTTEIAYNLRYSYQAMVILLNTSRLLSEHNAFVHLMAQKYPLTIINSILVRRLPHYSRSRNTVIYIILTCATDTEYALKFYMKRFNGMSPRPKCIIIHFHNGMHLFNFENIMENTWELKYLDLTFIDINTKRECLSPLIYYYNPFINKKYKNSFNQSIQIFPDKLVDVNRYQLVGVDSHISDITKDYFGNLKIDDCMDRSVLPVISIALQKLNVVLNFSAVYEDKGGYINFQRKETGSNSLGLTGLHMLDGYQKIVAVVPKLRVLKLLNVYKTLIHIGVLLIVIKIGSTVNKILRTNSRFWNTFNIIQQLIGGSYSIAPKTLMQKIFMVYFGFLSAYYSNEFYSSLIETKLAFDTIPLNTFEEIYESKFPIHSRFIHIPKYTSDEPYLTKIASIMNNSLLRSQYGKCIDRIYSNKNQICVMPEKSVLDFLIKNRKYQSTMKISECGFGYKEAVFFLDYNSPFIPKLQKIIYRIVQSGISQHYAKTPINEDEELSVNDADSLFIFKILISVLMIGHISAIFIFIFEIMFNKYRRRLNMFVHNIRFDSCKR